jgi:hypothetical protein
MQGGGEGHESHVAREPEIVKNCNHKDGGSQRPSQHEHHPSAQHGECEESPEAAIPGMGM